MSEVKDLEQKVEQLEVKEEQLEQKEEQLEQKVDEVVCKYGWKRDLPSKENHHDNMLSVAHPTVLKAFPEKLILDKLPPQVYDQGQLGSCTANALCGAFEFEQIKENLTDFIPSRLFLYYNERVIENTVGYDSGASLSDGIQVLKTSGVCPTKYWPYLIHKYKEHPPKLAFDMAKPHQITASKPVPNSIDGFKTMINMGYPVAFGFTVYESFETQEVAKTGIMPLPAASEKVLGGHAVLCVGYDDTMKSGDSVGCLYVRNSWGPNWGLSGYFYMPYAYVTDLKLVSDLWVITKNESHLIHNNKKLSTVE